VDHEVEQLPDLGLKAKGLFAGVCHCASVWKVNPT
jgi:hypothetical protein